MSSIVYRKRTNDNETKKKYERKDNCEKIFRLVLFNVEKSTKNIKKLSISFNIFGVVATQMKDFPNFSSAIRQKTSFKLN